MKQQAKIALLFPGQGAQYLGMGKEFFEAYSSVRELFEEADDLLGRNISNIILNGPLDVLTQTKNSQVGIFVICSAILKVLSREFPDLTPAYCAGLSLGEYTALYAAKSISFADCLKLVDHRSRFMNDACEGTKGTMAVIIGLNAHEVEDLVNQVNMPHELWVANLNCPGQVVISGTLKGIEAGTIAAKNHGAKRVLPLQVHGAFHSGLMKEAEERLTPYVNSAPIHSGTSTLVMNVTGTAVEDVLAIKENLIKQVTRPVRWEQGIRSIMEKGVNLFIEVGCGRTLSGFNKRIGVPVPTVNIEYPKELELLTQYF